MRDYDSFFLASADDDLLATQAVMIDAFGPEYTIAMVTSRPAWIGGLTVEWLETHHVRWDLIIMRSNMDYRQAPLVKAEAMAQLRHVGFEPKLAFDDDARNVAAYADLGIPCVYIHSGYHS